MKKTLTLFLSLIILSACKSNESKKETEAKISITNSESLQNFVTEKTFYSHSSTSEDPYYTFHNNGKFELNLKDKRSGQQRTFTGSYKASDSKYLDSGESFTYLRLAYDNPSYSDIGFFVYYDEKLVVPMSSGVSIKNEDEYGLRCKKYNITLSPDYARYSLQ
jgi:hypothetical protein